MSKFKSLLHVISLVVIVSMMLNLSGAQAAGSLGTAFTYQGQLKDGGGNPITNTCDFQFGLYPALSGGSLVAGTTLQTVPGVAVTGGYFTVSLDFGLNAFDGNARWLGIGVSCPSGGSYTTLTPRQPLTAAPYALYAVKAGTAASLSGVLPLANGGTGSATKNFVDLTTAQTVGGIKTFSSAPSFTAGTPFNVTGSNLVTNLNADQLDGQHASAFQQHAQNVRVVAKSGGDYTTITAALGSITDASATNPYLIYVAPGVYTEQVTMQPYVDIEGAGEDVTKITQPSLGNCINCATLYGSNNTELRFLTVESTGGQAYAIAIYNFIASPKITQVTALASGGSDSNYGVRNRNSSSAMTNVTASASGGTDSRGVENEASAVLTMTNVTATASGGGHNYGVYNSSSSPNMTNVTVIASGGTNNYGVWNDNSSPTMTSIVATVSGGTGTNYGVYNNTCASVTMTGVSVTVSGGTQANGVWNVDSSVVIQNSSITGTNNGIVNNSSSGSGTYTVKVNNSQISGGNSTIYVFNTSATYNIFAGASEFIGGGAQGPGVNFTYACIYSYKSNYTALNGSCQ